MEREQKLQLIQAIQAGDKATAKVIIESFKTDCFTIEDGQLYRYYDGQRTEFKPTPGNYNQPLIFVTGSDLPPGMSCPQIEVKNPETLNAVISLFTNQ